MCRGVVRVGGRKDVLLSFLRATVAIHQRSLWSKGCVMMITTFVYKWETAAAEVWFSSLHSSPPLSVLLPFVCLCIFIYLSLHIYCLSPPFCVFLPPPPPPPAVVTHRPVIFNALADMLYVRRSVGVLQRFMRTHPVACALTVVSTVDLLWLPS